jgi:hypothetical protein
MFASIKSLGNSISTLSEDSIHPSHLVPVETGQDGNPSAITLSSRAKMGYPLSIIPCGVKKYSFF